MKFKGLTDKEITALTDIEKIKLVKEIQDAAYKENRLKETVVCVNKRIFLSKKEADSHIHVSKLRSYKCPICKNYHHTSKR